MSTNPLPQERIMLRSFLKIQAFGGAYLFLLAAGEKDLAQVIMDRSMPIVHDYQEKMEKKIFFVAAVCGVTQGWLNDLSYALEAGRKMQREFYTATKLVAVG